MCLCGEKINHIETSGHIDRTKKSMFPMCLCGEKINHIGTLGHIG